MAQAGSTVRIIKKRSKISLNYPFTGTVWQTLNLSVSHSPFWLCWLARGTRSRRPPPQSCSSCPAERPARTWARGGAGGCSRRRVVDRRHHRPGPAGYQPRPPARQPVLGTTPTSSFLQINKRNV